MISLTWLSRVGSSVIRIVPGVGTMVSCVTLVFNLGESMLVGGLNYALEHVNAINTTGFDNVTFASVSFIGYANAVFPLEEFVTMWSSVAAGCLSIAAIRWVKSCIPTISN
jgi:hypothetical protein